MWQIVGLVLLPFAWMLLAAANQKHKEETGVSMPTRGAARRIRRNARKKGISEHEAHAQWVARKQQLAGLGPSASPRVSTRLVSPELPMPLVSSRRAERPRAPDHEPFSYEQLSGMAATFGWSLRKQAFSKFYLVAAGGRLVENPYAATDESTTDFDQRDLEDFLLTC